MEKQTTLFQVGEKEKNQLAAQNESEQMQDQDLAQQTQDLIEVVNMELGLEMWVKYVDLMPSATQVTVQSPQPLATELALSVEQDIVPIDEDPIMEFV